MAAAYHDWRFQGETAFAGFRPWDLDCVHDKRWPQVQFATGVDNRLLHPRHTFLRSKDPAFTDFLQDLCRFFATSFWVGGMVPHLERE